MRSISSFRVFTNIAGITSNGIFLHPFRSTPDYSVLTLVLLELIKVAGKKALLKKYEDRAAAGANPIKRATLASSPIKKQKQKARIGEQQ